MRRLIICAVLLVPLAAAAQSGVVVQYRDPASGSYPQVSPTTPLPVTGTSSGTAVPTGPTKFKGYGTLAVSTSSINLSTLTAGPNSPAWAMPFAGTLYVKNSEASAGNLFVCPLGGTCTAAIGIPLGPGASYGFNLGSATTSPTVIAASTATAVPQW